MYKFLLCARYVTTRPIGLVSVVSVMLGVATLIIVNSVMLGFQTQLRNRLHGILADVMVETPDINGFTQPEVVQEQIRKIAGERIAAMTPVMEAPGLLSYTMENGVERMMDVLIVGVDPVGRAAVGEFAKHLQSDANKEKPSFAIPEQGMEWRKANRELLINNDAEKPISAGAFVGYQMAVHRAPDAEGKLHEINVLPVGSEFVLSSVGVNTGRSKPKAVSWRFVVADWFRCDMSEYDAKLVFVPLAELQAMRIADDPARVSSIQIKLNREEDAAGVIADLQRHLGQFFYVSSWEGRQATLLQAVKVERWLLNFILFFIVAVAGFGILAIFFMIVVEKTKDIGILKALGASDTGVMGIFLSYALVLGLIGCALGVALGVWFTLNINPIERQLTIWTGIEIFPRNLYYFKEIPTLLDPMVVVWTSVLSLAIAVAASVLPARRAARLRPVEALRYE